MTAGRNGDVLIVTHLDGYGSDDVFDAARSIPEKAFDDVGATFEVGKQGLVGAHRDPREMGQAARPGRVTRPCGEAGRPGRAVTPVIGPLPSPEPPSCASYRL
jgi:hypothetical protein